MRPLSLLAPLLSFVLPLTAVADSHARHHHDLARRASGDVQLHKRLYTNARMTFYDVGLGACGQTSRPSDLIVALNQKTFGYGPSSPFCGREITIHCGDKSHSATILDSCPGCPENGGLDLSTGLFTLFAPESVGVLTCNWEFGGGGGNPDNKPKDPPKPAVKKPSTTPTPSHKTTHSSSAKKSSSSSKKSSTSIHKAASTSASLNLNKGPASGLAVPTGTIKPNDPQAINGLNYAVIGLGSIVAAGANLN